VFNIPWHQPFHGREVLRQRCSIRRATPGPNNERAGRRYNPLAMEVFLSYSWQDRRYADALRDRLQYAGLHVWDPERQLLPGSNWLIETGRALERADSVVFLISEDAFRSPWAAKEVEYAIGKRRLEGKVVPVLLSRSVRTPWILDEIEQVDATGRPASEVADEIARKLKSVSTNHSIVADRPSRQPPRASHSSKRRSTASRKTSRPARRTSKR
jgi:TIR domain